MGVNYNSRIVSDGLIFNMDVANPKCYKKNVHPYPLDIYAWVATGQSSTLSRDTTVTDSPAGGVPLKMVITGNDPFTNSYNSSSWNLAPAYIGQSWTVSVWVKASATTTAELFIFEVGSSGAFINPYSNGFNVYTYWTRISFTSTAFTSSSTTNVQIRLDGPNSGGTGVTIWWDGLQVESGSLTPFNSTTNTNGATVKDLVNNTSMTIAGTYGAGTQNGATYINLNNTTPTSTASNGTIALTTADLNALAFTNNFTVILLVKKILYGVGGNLNGSTEIMQGVANGYNLGWRIGEGNTGTQGTAFSVTPSFYLGLTELSNSSITVSPPNNSKFMDFVAFSVSRTTLAAFANGTFATPVTNNYGYVTGTSSPYISFTSAGMGSLNGRFGGVMIYDRALSNDEILQNYNVFTARYG